MNLRKIKLALTVDLLNSPIGDNPIHFAKSALEKFGHEAGGYQSTSETKRLRINDKLEHSTYAIKFDNCTLDLVLVSDFGKSNSTIQGFDLHENYS